MYISVINFCKIILNRVTSLILLIVLDLTGGFWWAPLLDQCPSPALHEPGPLAGRSASSLQKINWDGGSESLLTTPEPVCTESRSESTAVSAVLSPLPLLTPLLLCPSLLSWAFTHGRAEKTLLFNTPGWAPLICTRSTEFPSTLNFLKVPFSMNFVRFLQML